jgi:hypothetical protein
MSFSRENKIRRWIAPQTQFAIRRRRQPPRAAARDLFAGAPLHLGRHQRPGALHTSSGFARALLVPPAAAAPARAPQRQRFRVEALDRRKGGFPLRRLLIRRRPLEEQPAPARFSLPPFLHRRPFIPPRDSGEGGPREARWEGRRPGRQLSRRMPPPPCFAWSPSPAPFHCARADKRERSRGAYASELCQPRRRTNEASSISPPSLEKREAERRKAHPAMAAPQHSPPPRAAEDEGGGTAARRKQSTCADHPLRARSPVGAPPRRLLERANAPAQPRPRFTRIRGCGRYPHRHSRLSKAPCAPVVMPAGHSSGYLPVCICANCVLCL